MENHDVETVFKTLLAIEQIKGVKSRYFRTIDAQDWPGLRATLSPDLDFDHPTVGRHHNAGDMIRALQGRVATVRTVHQGHNAEVEVEGDRAVGRWSMQAFVFAPGAESGATMFANYEDEFGRIEGHWVLTRIRVAFVFGGPSAAVEGVRDVAL